MRVTGVRVDVCVRVCVPVPHPWGGRVRRGVAGNPTIRSAGGPGGPGPAKAVSTVLAPTCHRVRVDGCSVQSRCATARCCWRGGREFELTTFAHPSSYAGLTLSAAPPPPPPPPPWLLCLLPGSPSKAGGAVFGEGGGSGAGGAVAGAGSPGVQQPVSPGDALLLQLDAEGPMSPSGWDGSP